MNNKYQILLISSLLDELEAVSAILVANGYAVSCARDASQGLQYTGRVPVDLIISNLTEKAGLTGPGRANLLSHSIPVLFLAHDETEINNAAGNACGNAAGAPDHILIPCEPEFLLEKVSQLIKRKWMFDSLQESENRLRTIFENAALGIALVDLEGRPVQSNQALKKMLGYTGEELEKMSFTEFTHPDDVDRDLSLAQEVFEGKRDRYQIEKRYIKKTGEVIWANLTASSIRGCTDGKRLLIGMVEDITERRLAEEQLKESESRFRDIFEHANDLIYIHDLSGNYISINQTAERLFGYTREEIRSMNIKQIVVPEHLKHIRQRMSEKMDGGAQNTIYEADCLTKDGRQLTLEVNSRIIQKDGAPVAIQGIARDITERKHTQEALKNSEERYRDLYENANDLICTMDLTGKFTSFNRAGEILTGYRRDEAISMNFADVVVPEMLGTVREKIAGKASGHHPNTVYDLQIITKDGRRVWLEFNSRLIMHNGKPFGIQGIGRDVTERKQTLEALRTSEEQYRDLYENANDLIYTMDLEGKFTSLNRAGEIITGYSREEAITTNFSEIVEPRFLDLARQMIKRKLEGETPGAYELGIISKDGRKVSLELNTRVIFHNGKPVGIQGIGRDISERKRVEAESEAISAIIKGVTSTSDMDELLELVHQSLKNVIYAENCFVALHDKKTDLIHIPFCKDKFDTAAPPQKLGKGLTAYILRKARPMLMPPEVIEQLISQGEIELVGTPPAIWLGVPLRTPNGIIGVLVLQHYEDKNAYNQRDLELLTSVGDQIATAIERKLTDEALRENEERYRLLFESNPFPIWVYDCETLAFLTVNDAAIRNYGYSREEFLSMTLKDIRPPEDVPGLLKRLAEHPGAPRRSGTWRHLKKDGTMIEAESTTHPLVFAGKKAGIVLVNDVTERKRVEKEKTELGDQIEYQRRRLNNIIDNLPGIVWETTIARDIAPNSLDYVSEHVVSMLGYSVEEWLSQPNFWLEIIHPEDKNRIEEEAYANYAQGKNSTLEFRWIAKDGRAIWVETRSVIVRNAEGAPLGLRCVTLDISERKIAEEALRENEAKFRDLFDNAPMPYHELDTDGYFTRVNHTEELLLGYKESELKGRRPSEIILEKDSRDAMTLKLLGAQPLHPVERTFIRKDGSLVSVLNEDRLIYDSEGNITGIRSTLQDITQRKLDEEQLRISATKLAEANERAIREYDHLLKRLATLAQSTGAARDLATIFSAILDFAYASVPCAGLFISLYDPEQSTRRIIYFWYNGKEMDVTDLEPVSVGTGIVGKSLTTGEVIVVNDYQNVVTKKPTTVYVGYDEDPREPRATIIAPMKIMGNAIGVIEVQSYELGAYTQEHATAMRMAANLAANAIENVRLLEQERKGAEQLREAQKLESVGRLAGGIAHDFNNMLTAINGYSDLILKRLPKEDPLRQNIMEIKKAGERSAGLTQQLLAFSRRQMLKPKVLDINKEVSEIGTLLQRLIGEDIQLVTEFAPELGRVEADPGQLSQVIMNLAVNARDAMPQGGQLRIETSDVRLDAEFAARNVGAQPGAYVRISVSDTGVGMSEEIQGHIFEPFYTTKAVGKGTGLGLATVYGIVNQSGGYIRVESEEGKGTTFQVFLPRIDEGTQESKADEVSELLTDGTETILLVEDEEIVRNLSSDILTSCGYKVIEACDGLDALILCQEPDMKFDLLVTDVVMPRMSGRQLSEKLSVLRPDAKVLFMSGYTDDAVMLEGVIGIDKNFIQKPFTFDAFTQKVREILDSKN